MVSVTALTALALFLSAAVSAAPVEPAVVVAEPGIASNWTAAIAGSTTTGPAFSTAVPAGTVEARELDVRDNADYTDVRRCPGADESMLSSSALAIRRSDPLACLSFILSAWGGADRCTFEPIVSRFLPRIAWSRHALTALRPLSSLFPHHRKSGTATFAKPSSTATGSTSVVAPLPSCVFDAPLADAGWTELTVAFRPTPSSIRSHSRSLTRRRMATLWDLRPQVSAWAPAGRSHT